MKHFMMSKKQTAAIIFTSFAIQETEIEIFSLTVHTPLYAVSAFLRQSSGSENC
jgi:hypothetical protein